MLEEEYQDDMTEDECLRCACRVLLETAERGSKGTCGLSCVVVSHGCWLALTWVSFFWLFVCLRCLRCRYPLCCCQCCSGIIITVMRHGQKDMDQLSKEVVMKLCAEIEKEDAEGDAKEDKK